MTVSTITTSATGKDVPIVLRAAVKYVALAPEKPPSHYVLSTDGS